MDVDGCEDKNEHEIAVEKEVYIGTGSGCVYAEGISTGDDEGYCRTMPD